MKELMLKKFKEVMTKYYMWICGLPLIGGAVHIVFHTVTHLFGIHGCP